MADGLARKGDQATSQAPGHLHGLRADRGEAHSAVILVRDPFAGAQSGGPEAVLRRLDGWAGDEGDSPCPFAQRIEGSDAGGARVSKRGGTGGGKATSGSPP